MDSHPSESHEMTTQPNPVSTLSSALEANPSAGQPVCRTPWEARLRPTRALTFEISDRGNLLATTSLSRPVQELSSDALTVLQRFAGGATPRQALEILRRDWAVDKVEFAQIVEHLQAQGLLLAEEAGEEPARIPGEASTVASVSADLAFGASASLPTHHALLTDVPRVMAYQRAIAASCAGKVVVEVGCGSGILSIFAARAGARKVIAIEEMEIADLAARMIDANGCREVVELRRSNSRNVVLDEPADVIVHEIFGVDPFEENLLPAIADARRRFLKPGGQLLPHRVEVLCLGLEVAEPPRHDRERMLAEAAELGGLYGVDFSPYVEMLRTAEVRSLPSASHDGTEPLFRPRVLSEPCQVLDLDLYDESPDLEAQLRARPLQIIRRGSLNGLILYFRAHLDAHTVLSTGPFAPLTTWGRRVTPVASPLAVSPGETATVEAELRTRLGKQALHVAVRASR